MNTGIVTTGISPFAIGSIETFQLDVDLNGLPHSLAGGSASLSIKDPTGAVATYTATIIGNDGFVTLTITGPAGAWTRAWKWQDAAGVVQVSLPIAFNVQASP